jgi:flagellar protein FlaI
MSTERSSKKKSAKAPRRRSPHKSTSIGDESSRMDEPDTGLGEEGEESAVEDNPVPQDTGVVLEPAEIAAPQPLPAEETVSQPQPPRSGFMSRFSKMFSRKPSEAAAPPIETAPVQVPAPEELQPVVEQESEAMEQSDTIPSQPKLAEPMGRPSMFGSFSRPPSDEVTAPEVEGPTDAPEPPEQQETQPADQAPVQEAQPATNQGPEPIEQAIAQPETTSSRPQGVGPMDRPARFGRLFSRKHQQQPPQPGNGGASLEPQTPPQGEAFAESLAKVEVRESDIPPGEDSRNVALQSEPGSEGSEPQESLRGVPGQQEVESAAKQETPMSAQTQNAPSTDVEIPVPGQQERQGVILTQVQSAQGPNPTTTQPVRSEPPATGSTQPPGAIKAELQQPEKQVPQYNFLTTYAIYPDNPEVYAGIVKDSETGGYRYVVVEPQMNLLERQIYAKITRLLVDELEVDMSRLKDNKSAQAYLFEETKKLAKKYSIKISPEAFKKVAYYFTRDYIQLGRIEVLMNDPRIEDISCDGPKIPLFIWHRDYESIPTNVIFKGDEELNTFASKLAYVSGKHISIANPIVDASLPDGSRIQITYGREVTRKGSTFTIRKFKGDPITIVDMLKYNTVSPELAAYLWYLTEKRMSLLVAGGTASGKTTTLNAISMFIPPDQKIVSVEDTPELNLSHRNWIQSISRGGGVAGEITLFDLLKAAMRQRPDIIIVGEVRGAEAFTLFQAIATGHGGLGTIHADSVEAAINRLTSEPMNVPKSLLGSTLDCLVMQLRIKLKDKSVRRMVHVAEIVGHEASSDQIVLNNAFKWDPVSDQYQFSGRSRLFEKITKRYGTTPDRIRRDLEDRKIFLKWLMAKNIRDYKDVSQQIREFYSDKEATMERAMRGLDSGDAKVGR